MFKVESIERETFYPLFTYKGIPVVSVRVSSEDGQSRHFSRAIGDDWDGGLWHYDAQFGANMYPFFCAGTMQGQTINRDACQPGTPQGDLIRLLDEAHDTVKGE